MVLINCTTKGCFKSSEAKLDKDTQDVICGECGNPIVNVSASMKRTLGSLGQVQRNNKAKPFQQYCSHCKENQSLFVSGQAANCDKCKSQIHVTAAFLQGLKLYLEGQKEYENEGIE